MPKPKEVATESEKIEIKGRPQRTAMSADSKKLIYKSTSQILHLKKLLAEQESQMQDAIQEERLKARDLRSELDAEKRRKVNQEIRSLIEGTVNPFIVTLCMIIPLILCRI